MTEAELARADAYQEFITAKERAHAVLLDRGKKSLEYKRARAAEDAARVTWAQTFDDTMRAKGFALAGSCQECEW